MDASGQYDEKQRVTARVCNPRVPPDVSPRSILSLFAFTGIARWEGKDPNSSFFSSLISTRRRGSLLHPDDPDAERREESRLILHLVCRLLQSIPLQVKPIRCSKELQARRNPHSSQYRAMLRTFAYMNFTENLLVRCSSRIFESSVSPREPLLRPCDPSRNPEFVKNATRSPISATPQRT